jgi:hypothetical protein
MYITSKCTTLYTLSQQQYLPLLTMLLKERVDEDNSHTVETPGEQRLSMSACRSNWLREESIPEICENQWCERFPRAMLSQRSGAHLVNPGSP